MLDLFAQHCLRTSRQSANISRSLSQLNLSSPPANKAGQLNTTAELPLGKLLLRDNKGVLAGIQARDERRRAGVAAADVEGPRDESAVGVGVENDVGAGVEGDAVLEADHIVGEELAAVGLAQGDGVGDLGAAVGLAEMAVANGRVASRVEVCH